MISETEAMRLADQVARALVKHSVWKAALAGASARESVLVRRIDRADEFYYVVTLKKADLPTARMAIHARTGALLRCHGLSTSGARLTKWVPPWGMLNRREGRAVSSRAGCPPLVVRASTANVLPTLVWRPSAASVTPLLPFYVAVIGDTLAYIRVDGRIYSELPPQLSGR